MQDDGHVRFPQPDADILATAEREFDVERQKMLYQVNPNLELSTRATVYSYFTFPNGISLFWTARESRQYTLLIVARTDGDPVAPRARTTRTNTVIGSVRY